MNIVLDKKKIFWVLGTIVLGAFGSGLWDLAIKPSLMFFVEFFVDVILGAFSGIQNSIYENISSLETEITGRFILSFFMGGLSGPVVYIVMKNLRNTGQKDIEGSSKPPSKIVVALFGVFVIAFSLFTVGITGYVIEKQNKYLKLKRIVSPFVSEKERLMFDSNFSLISSMDDYEQLMKKMTSIAVSNIESFKSEK